MKTFSGLQHCICMTEIYFLDLNVVFQEKVSIRADTTS